MTEINTKYCLTDNDKILRGLIRKCFIDDLCILCKKKASKMEKKLGCICMFKPYKVESPDQFKGKCCKYYIIPRGISMDDIRFSWVVKCKKKMNNTD